MRTVPDEPVPGEPTKILVIAGSVYGRPKPTAYIRLGDVDTNAEFVFREPQAGPPWAQMELVGGRLYDHQKEAMVWLGETEETPRDEQPGESYYQIGLLLPPGKSVVDLRFDEPGPRARPIAFRTVEFDLSADPTASPSGPPPGP